MPWNKRVAHKDVADRLFEIIHSTRFTVLFTKAEYEAASAVLDELSRLRRFRNIVRHAQDIVEEGEA